MSGPIVAGEYFADPVVHKLADLVLLLGQEAYVARRRSIALEALLVRSGVLQRGAVEQFAPDDDEQLALDAARDLLLSRLWAVLADDGPASSPLRAQWLADLDRTASSSEPSA